MFYIQVNDPEGKRYVLDAYIETDGNYKEIYIGDTCVRLLIKEGDSEAVLEDFNTRKSCDINRYLLMGALKYLVKTYKYVKTVHLSDVAVGIGDADDYAQKKGTRVYLTPKRLLLGKPGWYEEYFGAKPIQKTDLVIQTVLRKLSLTPEDVNRISKQSWGTTKDIEELNPEAKKLIHSDWSITEETILTYPVEIQVFTKLNGGGIKNYKRKSSQYTTDKIKALERRYSKR